ncbi:MAG TPA: 7-carboxy-7-deazaguanine synthase, partial [Alphaproteobacteria bacterium]|nr:7-carboxy-7-deazaguanine synthase [Alphaproteobacteria bacterium]
CNFCDTDFVGTDGEGGGKFENAQVLARAIAYIWGESPARRLVVFTGGEPLLQLDEALINAVHAEGFEVAVETNGTLQAPANIDWLCVSPKAGAELAQKTGRELKLVYPQEGLSPKEFEKMDFAHFWLQPMDGPDVARNTALVVDYCLQNPRWRVSLQTHKMMGIK